MGSRERLEAKRERRQEARARQREGRFADQPEARSDDTASGCTDAPESILYPQPQVSPEARGNGSDGRTRFGFQRWTNPDAEYEPVEAQIARERSRPTTERLGEVYGLGEEEEVILPAPPSPQEQLRGLFRQRQSSSLWEGDN